MDIVNQFIQNAKIDFWTIWGLAANGLFFLRFIVQWWESERKGKVVIPMVFWYLSLTGGAMVVVYGVVRYDIVFLLAGIMQILLYSRNIAIAKRNG